MEGMGGYLTNPKRCDIIRSDKENNTKLMYVFIAEERRLRMSEIERKRKHMDSMPKLRKYLSNSE